MIPKVRQEIFALDKSPPNVYAICKHLTGICLKNANNSWQEFRIMANYEWVRVDPDSPLRCQGVGKDGQCPFGAVPDSKYCPRHGGNRGVMAAKKQEARMYMLAKWQDRMGEMANHPRAKSVANELGIMRMVLEKKLEACKDETDLVMHAASLTELTREVGKLAKLSAQLDRMTGESLDRSQATAWVTQVINILTVYIENPDVLTAISEDMLAAFDAIQFQSAAELEKRT